MALLASSLFLAPLKAEEEKEIIGIDLGTTYSCVAAWQGDKVDIIANDQGNRITPSWVAFDEDGNRLIGDAAKNQAHMNPANTIFDSKRMLGRLYNDEKLKEDIKKWPFTVVEKDKLPFIQVTVKGEKKLYAPEQISAMILTRMKDYAESFLGKKISDAVITVPAYFNDAQRQATKRAGEIAGLNVVRIVNEPTAAAIAYGLDKKKSSNILIYDLGGGTFDVSILELSDGIFEVKSVNGNTHLGGQDFDNKLMDYIVQDIKSKTGEDVAKNPKIMGKVRQAAEKAKRYLSNQAQATIEIDNITRDKDYVSTISKAKFEQINADAFKSTLPPIEAALADAKLKKSDIDDIVLVGGSTRIPKIQELLKDFFNGKELTKSVHPDEAVALGAALQAGVLMGKNKTKDILLLDVTPLSVGIETVGGVMTTLIARNTVVPTKKVQVFSTAADNQDRVDIQVYEGERSMAKDNHFLGHFFLDNIPLAPRGVPQIEVTFDIDANGILVVTARDMASGNKQSININADKRRLSEAEINKMIQEAEENRVKDQEMKEKIEARSGLENYLYSLRTQANDEKGMGAKLSADDKKTILDAVSEKLSWMDSNKESAAKEDYEEQKAAVEKVVGPIVSKLYEGSGTPPPTGDHEDL